MTRDPRRIKISRVPSKERPGRCGGGAGGDFDDVDVGVDVNVDVDDANVEVVVVVVVVVYRTMRKLASRKVVSMA